MQVAFAALVAADEDQAKSWADMTEPEYVVVVAGPELDIAELIEDELILQLPRRVCFDESCEHKPAMQFFEAGGKAQSSLPADRQLPFRDLKEFVKRNGLATKQEAED
jgi:uncharacterized metal-binding protein YceD (DUF177 family)